MIRAIQSGFQGMQRAADLVDAAAADVASADTPAASQPSTSTSTVEIGDIPRDMVNLMVGRDTYDANAKVVEVAVGMLDRTLDKII